MFTILRVSFGIVFGTSFVLDGCTAPQTASTGGSESGGSSATGSTAELPTTADGLTKSSDGESTGLSPELPHERAARLACDARAALEASPVPDELGESRFGMGNNFPHRFQMNSAHPNISRWSGDYFCYDVGAVGVPDGEAWWFSKNSWVEDDGQIHVYMATAGIDTVVYYGSNEVHSPPGEPDVPGAPLTEAIEFDVSALCPELPRIWMPDPEGNPENAGRICMQHATTIAEAVFVRVP